MQAVLDKVLLIHPQYNQNNHNNNLMFNKMILIDQVVWETVDIKLLLLKIKICQVLKLFRKECQDIKPWEILEPMKNDLCIIFSAFRSKLLKLFVFLCIFYIKIYKIYIKILFLYKKFFKIINYVLFLANKNINIVKQEYYKIIKYL